MSEDSDTVDLGTDFQAAYTAVRDNGEEAVSRGLKAITGVLEGDSTSEQAPPPPQTPKSEPSLMESLLMKFFNADSKQSLMDMLVRQVKSWLGENGLGGVFNFASGAEDSAPHQVASNEHQPPENNGPRV